MTVEPTIEEKKAAIKATIVAEEQLLTRRRLFKEANPLLTEEQIADEVVKKLWWVNLDRIRRKMRKTLKYLSKMPTPLNMTPEESRDEESIDSAQLMEDAALRREN